MVYLLEGRDPDPGQAVTYGILSPYFSVQTVYNNTAQGNLGLVTLTSQINYDGLQVGAI